MSRETRTERLGEIASQPPNSKFTLQRRMPGWRADTQNNETTKFFPEEALRKDSNGKYEPFGVLFTGAAPDWVMGSALPDPPANDFDRFLTQIAKRVRRYNAALYWMRRLHFHENAKPIATPPPRNPHGDQDQNQSLPDLSTPDGEIAFQKMVKEAQIEWDRAVDQLNDILAGRHGQPTYGFKHTYADMVEVNGYIVSMRIVSQEAAPSGLLGRLEVGGSSSSHISISSAFSSPSP